MSSSPPASTLESPPTNLPGSERATARVLEVASYPPPRSGWSVRVEFLKKRIEAEGHQCIVLNIGPSRHIPSPEYDSVRGGGDLLRKLWQYSANRFVVHAHTNGDSIKGALLALGALLVNLARGRRGYLTFHAGAIQRYFPRNRAWALAPLYWLLFLVPRGIICNSEPVRQLIRGYGISGRKIVAIPAFSRQYLDFTPVPLSASLEDFFRRFPHVVFTYARMRPLFYPVTMIDGMARVMERRGDVGLVLCGGLSHMEEGLWKEVDGRIQAHGIANRILLIEDLDREAFLTALQRSSLYLRTPITDGVASSVLESLALGVPVVASENGTRPPGVLTYGPEDAAALAASVEQVVADRAAAVDRIGQLEIADTLAQEVALLTGTPVKSGRP
jgi:glycosyltransferase involved in cell wall biosynthesis